MKGFIYQPSQMARANLDVLILYPVQVLDADMETPGLTSWGAAEPPSQWGGEEPEQHLLHGCPPPADFR